MTLTFKEKTLLKTKGYYHLTWGTKVGWENQGSEDDIILDHIEKMQRVFEKYKERKYGYVTFLLDKKIGERLNKAWKDRICRRVDFKIADKFYPTEKYIEESLRKLNLYHLYQELTRIYPSKTFRIKADYPDQSETPTHLMIPDRIDSCAFCAEEDKVLWIIHNDTGIGVCKKCLFKEHRGQITYGNGRKIDFKKERKERPIYPNGDFWFNEKGIWVKSKC